MRDGGELWGSGVDVLNTRHIRAEHQIARVARAERQIAGLASVGVVGLSPPRSTYQQRRVNPAPPVTIGAGCDAHFALLAFGRSSSIREGRTGFLGASLRHQHAARLAEQQMHPEEEHRCGLLTASRKCHQKLRSSPSRGTGFQQQRQAATADPDSAAPLSRWQQTLTPWSAPPLPWLATGSAQRPFRLWRSSLEAQLFRNLDLDTPGSIARAAVYRSSYELKPYAMVPGTGMHICRP